MRLGRTSLMLTLLMVACVAPVAEPEPFAFTCAECGKGFNTRRKMKRHKCPWLGLAS